MYRLAFSAVFAISLSLGAAGQSWAEEDIGWTGEASLNGSKTTGNNDTTVLGFATKLENRGSDWRHSAKISADYGKNQGETNKRRYRLGYKIGRDFAPAVYGYANADYFNDAFGAYKSGYFAGGGVGYSVIVDDPTQWQIESGAGYRSQKARLAPNNPLGVPSMNEDFLSARLYSDFEHAFSDQVTFSNDTEVLYSEQDTFLVNEAGITSDLFDKFAVRASFRLETHSDVPEGREKTDTISRVGIVYKMN
ncbi:YdiY family protein [Litorimonas haliclonae]|uniref:DUF481 domain-containing protein n=1 Tax=Litorimonas haliclonae TaxID=2081977 RepID=UPI0039F07AC4